MDRPEVTSVVTFESEMPRLFASGVVSGGRVIAMAKMRSGMPRQNEQAALQQKGNY
jgi:hypothetical protein